MTPEQLQNVYDAQPFQPFQLHLADGRSLEIPHREFLAIHPRGRTAVVFRPDGSFNIVDVMLITGVEVQVRSRNGDDADRGTAERN